MFKIKLLVPVISPAFPSALAFTTVYSSSPEIVPNFEKSSDSTTEYFPDSSTLKASPYLFSLATFPFSDTPIIASPLVTRSP